jgi:carboxypeptidase Taq
MKAYLALEQRFARRAAIQDALGILHWDSETMMPKAAAPYRAEATAELRGMAHDLLAHAEVQDLLAAAEEDKGSLDPWQLANLREMRRLVVHEMAVPRTLVEANAKAVVKARLAWREARAGGEFARLVSPLGDVVELQRAIGAAKGRALGVGPYDALLDAFDPGLRTTAIDPVFAALREDLPHLIEKACARQARLPPVAAPKGPFPAGAQRRLAESVMGTLGFDFARGRLDDSPQPFCGGATDDVRVTETYDEADFLSSLMAVFHECGHALYEQGRPRHMLRQPVGRARGLTLHESQALLMEMQACCSREFVCYLAPLARAAFGATGDEWSADNLHRLMSKVEPRLIRIDADEMTYVLHAVIRYDLERAMIDGALSVDNLPAAYNDAVRRTLGLDVPNDREGCLQDIHWSAGLWGYFPSYALGAILAAQLFETACRACPDILPSLARGEPGGLRTWLRANVYDKASLLETGELVAAATGRPLEYAPYAAYLARRYVDAN